MANEPEVRMRIVAEKPPVGVAFAVQLGRHQLAPMRPSGGDLAFEFALRVKFEPGGRVVFLGPAAQGPPRERFVYVNSGTSAGQVESCWTRRAKVKLASIDADLARQALSGGVLEARIAATGRDGGPACASVPLLGGSWRLAG